MHPAFIPLARPYLDHQEEEAVLAVVRSGVLSMGEQILAFEEAFAKMMGGGHAVAVSSGTAALHLAVRLLGIGPGDEVITTPFSFVSSANCMLFEGATPRFVDIEFETLGLDPNAVKTALSKKTKAILPVHVFGVPCSISKLTDIAHEHNIPIIEDACESLKSIVDGRLVGTFGAVSVFGFYPNKQITTGEGGILYTKDEHLAELARSLRNQGRQHDTTWLLHNTLGYNYRMAEINAALGVVQLKKLDQILAIRASLANYYVKKLTTISELRLLSDQSNCKSSLFAFVVRVAANQRDGLVEWLNLHYIQSKPYFAPCIHLQPFYRSKFGYKEGDFPVAEQVSRECLALPFYTGMSHKEIDRIVASISEYFGR